jgi:glucose-6-phosphate isomerase
MNRLEYHGRTFTAGTRTVEQMKSVIYDKEWLTHADLKKTIYYMFRAVYREEHDIEIMTKFNVRYDITIIPPMTLGVEYVKTLGHFHPRIEGSELSYPEVYEVLEGQAQYLLQKGDQGNVVDTAVIEAEQGDVVIIPPNYGHVTINPSNHTLKMANWVETNFASAYTSIIAYNGAAYFKLTNGLWIQNENYHDIPELRFVTPEKIIETDMYRLIRKPEKLRFLTNPSGFPQMFDWITE